MSIPSSRSELIKKLDAEGDLAADYLEELLDIADLDGDIEISVEAERAAVAVVTDGPADRRLKRLIGRNGEVLESLQELTRLAVQSKTGERSRLMLDIAGYREAHRAEIAAIAREAIATVLMNGESVTLPPMNPFERKVVHDIAAAANVVSDSAGVGSSRHVVIALTSLESSAGGEDGDDAVLQETTDDSDQPEIRSAVMGETNEDGSDSPKVTSSFAIDGSSDLASGEFVSDESSYENEDSNVESHESDDDSVLNESVIDS